MNRSLQSIVRLGKHACIFAAITLGTTRCASTSDGQLAQGQGAAIGAGVGALAGNLIGGNTQGTLIGAGIGGLAGLAVGTHIANKKASYASTEDWLDACIVQAEDKRKAAVAYNDRLNRELTRLRSEVRMAKAANDRSKLASLKREIASERCAAQKQSAAFSKEVQANRSAIRQADGNGGSRLKSLRSTTSGIETQVSTMNKTEQSLASLQNETDA
jgi:uncharacterized protein YcfJ